MKYKTKMNKVSMFANHELLLQIVSQQRVKQH